MTDRQKTIESVTDSMYYYMIELTSLASQLESVGLDKEGDDLRSIADEIERLAIRLLNKKQKRKKDSAPVTSN